MPHYLSKIEADPPLNIGDNDTDSLSRFRRPNASES